MEHYNHTKGRENILVAYLIIVKQLSVCILSLKQESLVNISPSYISLFESSRAKAAERKMKLTPRASILETRLNLK